MADSQFVVAIECEGFVHEGDPGTDNQPLDADTADAVNNEKLEHLTDNYGLVEHLVRDSGSGILYFEWDPPAETEDDGAAHTWHSAKLYTDHIRSAVVGVGFQVNEVTVSVRGADFVPGAEGPKGDHTTLTF